MTEYKGSFGLVTHQGKVLMLHRDDNSDIESPNTWCFIGGRDEEGETYEQTFLREAGEEINIKPTNARFLQLFEPNGERYAVFECPLTDEEAEKVKLGNEGQELRFVDFEELQQLPLAPIHLQFVTLHTDVVKKALDEG